MKPSAMASGPIRVYTNNSLIFASGVQRAQHGYGDSFSFRLERAIGFWGACLGGEMGFALPSGVASRQLHHLVVFFLGDFGTSVGQASSSLLLGRLLIISSPINNDVPDGVFLVGVDKALLCLR
jgi:hypothetical protein